MLAMNIIIAKKQKNIDVFLSMTFVGVVNLKDGILSLTNLKLPPEAFHSMPDLPQ